MTERTGVVGTHPLDGDGRVYLTMYDGRMALVAPDSSDAVIAAQFDLDVVRRMPPLNFCAGRFLDGPRRGHPDGYALNELGFHVQVTSGDRILIYEVVTLASGDEPAHLRYVSAEPRRPGPSTAELEREG